MSLSIINQRVKLCSRCKLEKTCESRVKIKDLQIKCPLDLWPDLINPMPLGTMVASVVEPIARSVDKYLGTNIYNCRGCSNREEKLNAVGFRIANGLGVEIKVQKDKG